MHRLWEKMKKLSFSRKIVLGFFSVIILGTLLLQMPFSLAKDKEIDILTSMFTVTSAVCVTGLSTIDISQTLSKTGQILLLILIQLGGLGVMTFSSLLFLLIGKKISYKDKALLKEERNAENSGEIIDFLKRMIKIVFFIEGMGAILLTCGFMKEFSFGKALYFGIFHSVSAFCNAGFALFPNNLENYSNNILISLTIATLITLGGIGFAVINSLIEIYRKKRKRFNLTSKVAILISFVLTILGTILFMMLEYTNPTTIANYGVGEKLLISFFQSVTTRTAGFNTVSILNLKPATVFMFCIFMFIGASPGSTGGGIKTTTIGIIILYVLGIIRGEENITVFKRRVDWDILNRALAILVLSIIYTAIVIILLMSIEKDISFEKIVFEVVSAFGTVGLSMGVTPLLDKASQLLIIITMFIGRLGPMTFALALGEKKVKKNLKYPKENILVG